MTSVPGGTKTLVVIGNGKAAVDFLETIRDYRPATAEDVERALGWCWWTRRTPTR